MFLLENPFFSLSLPENPNSNGFQLENKNFQLENKKFLIIFSQVHYKGQRAMHNLQEWELARVSTKNTQRHPAFEET